MTGIMELFVISLRDAKDRRERLIKSLKPHHIAPHWIEAIDARGWSDEKRATYCDRAKMFWHLSFHPPAGAIGCYLSHLSAYQTLLDSDEDCAIILEDDAEVTADFGTYLADLKAACQAIDLIFLADRRPNRPSIELGTTSSGLRFIAKKYANIGGFGYVITRQAAAQLLAQYHQFGLTIDNLLHSWWLTGLKTATISPELVIHDDMGSAIGYDNLKAKHNLVQTICYRVAKSYISVKKRLFFSSYINQLQQAIAKQGYATDE